MDYEIGQSHPSLKALQDMPNSCGCNDLKALHAMERYDQTIASVRGCQKPHSKQVEAAPEKESENT